MKSEKIDARRKEQYKMFVFFDKNCEDRVEKRSEKKI